MKKAMLFFISATVFTSKLKSWHKLCFNIVAITRKDREKNVQTFLVGIFILQTFLLCADNLIIHYCHIYLKWISN